MPTSNASDENPEINSVSKKIEFFERAKDLRFFQSACANPRENKQDTPLGFDRERTTKETSENYVAVATIEKSFEPVETLEKKDVATEQLIQRLEEFHQDIQETTREKITQLFNFLGTEDRKLKEIKKRTKQSKVLELEKEAFIRRGEALEKLSQVLTQFSTMTSGETADCFNFLAQTAEALSKGFRTLSQTTEKMKEPSPASLTTQHYRLEKHSRLNDPSFLENIPHPGPFLATEEALESPFITLWEEAPKKIPIFLYEQSFLNTAKNQQLISETDYCLHTHLRRTYVDSYLSEHLPQLFYQEEAIEEGKIIRKANDSEKEELIQVYLLGENPEYYCNASERFISRLRGIKQENSERSPIDNLRNLRVQVLEASQNIETNIEDSIEVSEVVSLPTPPPDSPEEVMETENASPPFLSKTTEQVFLAFPKETAKNLIDTGLITAGSPLRLSNSPLSFQTVMQHSLTIPRNVNKTDEHTIAAKLITESCKVANDFMVKKTEHERNRRLLTLETGQSLKHKLEPLLKEFDENQKITQPCTLTGVSLITDYLKKLEDLNIDVLKKGFIENELRSSIEIIDKLKGLARKETSKKQAILRGTLLGEKQKERLEVLKSIPPYFSSYFLRDRLEEKGLLSLADYTSRSKYFKHLQDFSNVKEDKEKITILESLKKAMDRSDKETAFQLKENLEKVNPSGLSWQDLRKRLEAHHFLTIAQYASSNPYFNRVQQYHKCENDSTQEKEKLLKKLEKTVNCLQKNKDNTKNKVPTASEFLENFKVYEKALESLTEMLYSINEDDLSSAQVYSQGLRIKKISLNIPENTVRNHPNLSSNEVSCKTHSIVRGSPVETVKKEIRVTPTTHLQSRVHFFHPGSQERSKNTKQPKKQTSAHIMQSTLI